MAVGSLASRSELTQGKGLQPKGAEPGQASGVPKGVVKITHPEAISSYSHGRAAPPAVLTDWSKLMAELLFSEFVI